MKKFVVAAISGAVFLFSGQGIAADVEAGKKKAAEACASCHGPDGNSPAPNFPKIAGQPRTYIEKALKDYKTGERKDPIMAGIVAPLTQQEIENLAFYFSEQSGLYYKR